MDSGGLAEKGWKSPIESPVRGTKRVCPACHSCHFPLAFRKNYPKEGGGLNERKKSGRSCVESREGVATPPRSGNRPTCLPLRASDSRCIAFVASQLYHDWERRGPSTSNRHFPSPLAPRNLATTFASRWRFFAFSTRPTVCRHG